MLKNLVFDFGNVLVYFQPIAYFRPLFDTDEEAKMWIGRSYGSEAWKNGDRGLYTRQQALDGICALYPDVADKLCAALSRHTQSLLMPEHTPALLSRLRAAGFGLYYISNTSTEDMAFMMREHPALAALDGGVPSCAAHAIKPEPRIFQILLEQYGLQAEECLFVDDVPENTAAAEREGFRTLTLTTGADTLERALMRVPEIAEKL